MTEEYAIEVKNISKSFKIKSKKGKKSKLGIGSGKTEPKTILENITFNVKKGSSLGIIGTNGAGKSTLLKIISGVMEPDSGEVHIRGRVASLLELGIGFHSELTGRENIYIKGSTFGLSRKEIESRVDSIIEFAELGEYIDEPIRAYSSGMNGRLAFAIAINIDADVIIADEILSVGDIRFKERCSNVFRSMRKKGATIIIVSHGLSTIREMCDKAVWIRDGKIFESGNCKKVCDKYENEEGSSFKAMLRSAEEGDDQAQNRLATMYRDGVGVETDYCTALTWFKASAEKENREAQRNLGDMISKGLGVERDQTEALRWFTTAAEAGDTTAMSRVANMHKDGVGTKVDKKEALRWFEELADRGNAAARATLAEMILKGDGAEKDEKKAFDLYMEAAEAGNNTARHKIGIMYLKGIGTERNILESIKWLSKSAAQGNIGSQTALMGILSLPEIKDLNIDENEINVIAYEQLDALAENGNVTAQKNLASRLLSGVGVKQNAEEALKWFIKVAETGDAGARHQVGVMFEGGIGTDKDSEEALKWFKLAAEQENKSSVELIARMMITGGRVDKDEKMAFALLKAIADGGNAGVRNKIGTMYRDGVGTEVNILEARTFFELAAEQGNVNARVNLADILRESGDEENAARAVYWYKKAADNGNVSAYFWLGMMYKDGIGTSINIEEAMKWFKIAADKNNKNAQKELQKLKS